MTPQGKRLQISTVVDDTLLHAATDRAGRLDRDPPKACLLYYHLIPKGMLVHADLTDPEPHYAAG